MRDVVISRELLRELLELANEGSLFPGSNELYRHDNEEDFEEYKREQEVIEQVEGLLRDE